MKLQSKPGPEVMPVSISSGLPTGSMGTGSPETIALPDLKPLMFVSSLEDITLHNWIEMDTKGDYSALIMSGEPTQEELYMAWLGLQGQYMALTDKQGADSYMLDISETESLKMRINDVKYLLYALQLTYDERLIEQLRGWDITEALTPESYRKDITRIENRLKSDEMRLMMANNTRALREPQGDRQGTMTAEGETTANTRENYLKILLQIGKMRKMHYSPRLINTFDFAVMYGELKEYYNMLKKTNHGSN